MEPTYKDKANRDKRFKELKDAGHTVTRYTMRGQLLHPMYVFEDRDTPEGRDTGFGNTVYKTYYRVLYEINHSTRCARCWE